MIIKGDLDFNGRIDIYDILTAFSIVTGSKSPTNDELLAGDIDGDGEISIADIIRISNHINGISIINEVIE